MPSFEQGDVVRVPFPYTDRATWQSRPALVVSSGLGEDRRLIWVVMIRSAENRPWDGDVSFGERFANAGLPAPSVVRPCKIATMEADRAQAVGHADPAVVSRVLAAIGTALATTP